MNFDTDCDSKDKKSIRTASSVNSCVKPMTEQIFFHKNRKQHLS